MTLPRSLHGCVRSPVMLRRTVVASFVLAAGVCSPSRVVQAQAAQESSDATEMPDVVVSASRREQQSFDAPAAIQSVGREIRTGSVQVNDLNSDNAPSATIADLRGGWRFPIGAWRLSLLARIDNTTDRSYFGSVIVNDGNDRFFEPAPGRTWLLAAQAGYRF